MLEAVKVFSRGGMFSEVVKARDIRSREHFRKIWPVVSCGHDRKLVTWVRPIFDDEGGLSRSSHFRVLNNGRDGLVIGFDKEEMDRVKGVNESKEHKKAKDVLQLEISRRIKEGGALPWSFKDPDASDFSLVGNLLLGASEAIAEYPLKTPFGSEYRLDIAVLAEPIDKEPMVIAGIEIELSHSFDGRKAILGKSLGFPLLSVDINGVAIEEINSEWAAKVLSETTVSSERGRRKTYVYVHDLLYPLYIKFPDYLRSDDKHQFLIFDDELSLKRLISFVNKLKMALGYGPYEVAPALVNAKNRQSKLMLERAGEIAGSDWKTYNESQCVRLTMPRSKGSFDLRSYKFYMTVARAILSHTNALVGYMYANGHVNEDPDEPVWIHRRWIKEEKRWESVKVLPKRLAEPVSRIMRVVSDLQAQG